MTERINDVLVGCRGVARTYGAGENAVVAVHEATCEIASGDRIGLVGPSGSGKTTLLHLIAGLDEPTIGSITWPAFGNRSALRPGRIGVVFQSPSLMAPLNVLENVTLPLLLMGVEHRSATKSALEALERLDLEGLSRKLPEELSGGQAQRVAVARVLASKPSLILADEPTGQLDHLTGGQVIDVLLETAATLGSALLINTHDPAVADRLPQRWSMADGRLTVVTALAAC